MLANEGISLSSNLSDFDTVLRTDAYSCEDDRIFTNLDSIECVYLGLRRGGRHRIIVPSVAPDLCRGQAGVRVCDKYTKGVNKLTRHHNKIPVCEFHDAGDLHIRYFDAIQMLRMVHSKCVKGGNHRGQGIVPLQIEAQSSSRVGKAKILGHNRQEKRGSEHSDSCGVQIESPNRADEWVETLKVFTGGESVIALGVLKNILTQWLGLSLSEVDEVVKANRYSDSKKVDVRQFASWFCDTKAGVSLIGRISSDAIESLRSTASIVLMAQVGTRTLSSEDLCKNQQKSAARIKREASEMAEYFLFFSPNGTSIPVGTLRNLLIVFQMIERPEDVDVLLKTFGHSNCEDVNVISFCTFLCDSYPMEKRKQEEGGPEEGGPESSETRTRESSVTDQKTKPKKLSSGRRCIPRRSSSNSKKSKCSTTSCSSRLSKRGKASVISRSTVSAPRPKVRSLYACSSMSSVTSMGQRKQLTMKKQVSKGMTKSSTIITKKNPPSSPPIKRRSSSVPPVKVVPGSTNRQSATNRNVKEEGMNAFAGILRANSCSTVRTKTKRTRKKVKVKLKTRSGGESNFGESNFVEWTDESPRSHHQNRDVGYDHAVNQRLATRLQDI